MIPRHLDGYFIVPRILLFEDPVRGLTPAARDVFLTLLAHRNDQSGLAWPSQQTISELLNIGLSTVRLAVVELMACGLLEGTKRWHDGASRYVYTFPTIDCCADDGATKDEALRNWSRNGAAQTSAQQSETVAQNCRDCCADSPSTVAQKPAHKHTENIRENTASDGEAADAAAARRDLRPTLKMEDLDDDERNRAMRYPGSIDDGILAIERERKKAGVA